MQQIRIPALYVPVFCNPEFDANAAGYRTLLEIKSYLDPQDDQ
jgi:hypothetical protein